MVGKGQNLVIYSDEAVAPYVSFEYRFPFAIDMKSFIYLYIPHYLGCHVHFCLTFLKPMMGFKLCFSNLPLFCFCLFPVCLFFSLTLSAILLP